MCLELAEVWVVTQTSVFTFRKTSSTASGHQIETGLSYAIKVEANFRHLHHAKLNYITCTLLF